VRKGLLFAKQRRERGKIRWKAIEGGKRKKKKEKCGKGEIGKGTDGQLSTTAANRSETIFLGWIIIERMTISK
jgi:hypothetical protein